MRDVLLGCELPATISQRAAKALEDLRADFTWIEGRSTALVRHADRSLRWWTFGGLYANAALAAYLKQRHGFAVRADDGFSRRESGAGGAGPIRDDD